MNGHVFNLYKLSECITQSNDISDVEIICFVYDVRQIRICWNVQAERVRQSQDPGKRGSIYKNAIFQPILEIDIMSYSRESALL